MSTDKIVNLAERLEHKRQKKQMAQYRGKIETIQKIVQCGSCKMRCAMCGLHLERDESSASPLPSSAGLIFCESCRSEFDDFLSVSKGGERSEVFWHNKEWEKMWSSWIKYRKAMTAFVDSSEFKLLMEELKTCS